MRKIFLSCITFLLAFILFGINTYAAEISKIRIAGDTRYDTAVDISKTAFSKADTVVLSTAFNFPDALAGGPLAFKYNAPILLTSVDSLGDATRNEILRLEAKKAIILGGTGAVSQKVIDELRYIGVTVERIGGVNRFETATLIAGKLDKPTTAIVSFGYNYPDALAIAPYAAKNGYPILLVNTHEIPEVTKQFLKNIKNTIVVGGPGVVSEKVLSQLPNPKRISGIDRFQTNAKIIQELQKDSFTSYVVTGYNFADALTGSVLAAKNNAALLLTQPTFVPAPIHFVLNEKKFSEAIPIGGKGVVSDGVIEEITQLIKNDTMAKALPVEVNNEYKSHLISRNDVDYYKIKLTNPGNLNVGVYRNDSSDLIVSLYDQNSNLIGTEEIEPGSGPYGINFGVPAGEYFIQIKDAVGYQDYYDDNERYTFFVKFDSSVKYEEELNDKIANSTTVPLNKAVKGTMNLKSNSDLDHYDFSLSKPGKVELEFNRNETSDWIIQVFNVDEKEIAYTEIEEGIGSTKLEFGLPAGKFYLKVIDARGYQDFYDDNEFYSFTLHYQQSDFYEKELNDKVDTASLVTTSGTKYSGSIHQRSNGVADVDYYKFKLVDPGNIIIEMDKKESTDYFIYVYDAAGNTVGYHNVLSGKDSVQLNFGLPAGEYFIKIYDDLGYQKYVDLFEPYSFSVKYEQSNHYEKELNDKHYNATKLSLNQTYKGTFQTKSSTDLDYYEFTLTAPSNVTFTMPKGEYSDWSYKLYNSNNLSSHIDFKEVEEGFGTYSKQYSLAAGTYYLLMEDVNGYQDYNDDYEVYSFQLTK